MNQMIGVIICTHNPRRDYLDRVLAALKAQTLPLEQWELLFIDNASNSPLASDIALSWHPHARFIREDKLGLTYARLCGIQSSNASVLVFVDDDNILSQNYLALALEISQRWPILGAWGGQCLPTFEIDPPEWTRPYWEYLGIRLFDCDKWSGSPSWETTPIGAGLCVRKAVAAAYVDIVKNDSSRATLDRKGDMLLGCGDMDLAYTAYDIGLGNGVFEGLKLAHLMPPNRLTEGYLLKLVEQTIYSTIILRLVRGGFSDSLSWEMKIKQVIPIYFLPKVWLLPQRERKFYKAIVRGHRQGIRIVLSSKS